MRRQLARVCDHHLTLPPAMPSLRIEHIHYNGTPCVRLHGRNGSAAVVALHGAQVLSWIPADGRERLFLSEHARFEAGAAIRGGIPVIFPQFGERGELAKHGFARNLPWHFIGVDNLAVFGLTNNPATAYWPHAFAARLHVALPGDALEVSLEIKNTGETPFLFNAALHTYLRVHDLDDVTLEGLQGCDYEDSTAGGTLHRENDFELRFNDETDRIYNDVVAPLTLRDGMHSLHIEQEGFPDVVVWNPGATLAASIGDLAPGEHRHFVCVEAGQVLQPELLHPGDSWMSTQRLG